MQEWLLVLGCGAAGALVTAHLTGRGFSGWEFFSDVKGRRRLDIGTIGDVAVGSLAALVLWGLNPTAVDAAQILSDPRILALAVLHGAGGGKIFSSLIERSIQDSNLVSLAKSFEDLTKQLEQAENDRTAKVPLGNESVQSSGAQSSPNQDAGPEDTDGAS